MAARPKAKAKKPIPGSARWDRALRAIGEMCAGGGGMSKFLDETEKTLRDRRHGLLAEMGAIQEELVRIDAVLRLLGGDIPATYRRNRLAEKNELAIAAFGEDVLDAQTLGDRLKVSRQRGHQLLHSLFHQGRIVRIERGLYQRVPPSEAPLEAAE